MQNKKNIKLQAGDVLNCYSNGLLGKIIRKVTKSRFNQNALTIAGGYQLVFDEVEQIWVAEKI